MSVWSLERVHAVLSKDPTILQIKVARRVAASDIVKPISGGGVGGWCQIKTQPPDKNCSNCSKEFTGALPSFLASAY